jgi:hypothetical protein
MTEQHMRDHIFTEIIPDLLYNRSEIIADGIIETYDTTTFKTEKDVKSSARFDIAVALYDDKQTDLCSNTYIKLSYNNLCLDPEEICRVFKSIISSPFSKTHFSTGDILVVTNILFCYLHNYETKFDINAECITIPIFYPGNYFYMNHTYPLNNYLVIRSNHKTSDILETVEIGNTHHILNDDAKKTLAIKQANSILVSDRQSLFSYKSNKLYNITDLIGYAWGESKNLEECSWPKFILLNFFTSYTDIDFNIDLYTIHLSINDTQPIIYTRDDFYKIQIAGLDFWIVPLSDEAKSEETLKDACEDGSFYNTNKNKERTETFIENVEKLTIMIDAVSFDNASTALLLVTPITVEYDHSLS